MTDTRTEITTGNSTLNGDLNPSVDLREALFNGGEIGPVSHIQASTERIVQLRGILYDLDPKLIQQSSLIPFVPLIPSDFYDRVAKHWLKNHPVLAKAEVRCSGTGLHAILRVEPPVVIKSDQDRNRWSGILQAVQAALPIDTDQPGITAVTRPLGSTNIKNGATVSQLKPGEPVSIDDVLSLYDEMKRSPFKTVLRILTGTDRIEPCPMCNEPTSKLSAMDFIGMCYGSCGKVSLAQFYDLVLTPRIAAPMEGDHHDA